MDKWTPEYWIANESECKKTLMEPGNLKKIPLLFHNETAMRTLVRFKGMIQDMLNPEYYSKTFTIVNSITKETKICQGKYYSTIINEPEEEVQDEVEHNCLMERQIIACIKIPGLNKWSDDEVVLEEISNKRIRLDPECPNYSKKEVFVFLYPEDFDFGDTLKLNTVIEVVGFLDRRTVQGDNEDPNSQPSVVKETYCIHAVHLEISPNPLLLSVYEDTKICIWNEASNLHKELKSILTQVLLGDSLAAEYLLFYLVSPVHREYNQQAYVQYSLNIRGIPDNIGTNYITKLYSLISDLVVKSRLLHITISEMNKMDLVPKKCYTSNRLSNGLLQLTDGTLLILDETDLQPGQLDNKGTLNVQAITDIILEHHVKYDFTYYKIGYGIQMPLLTLSNSKSLFPCRIDVVLHPDPTCVKNIDETLDSAHSHLKSQSLLLEKLRMYIMHIASFPIDFGEDISNHIQNDYVEMRRADPNISPDDLHIFIMTSKLIALCSGNNEMNKEIWESCKSLEHQRKLRTK